MIEKQNVRYIKISEVNSGQRLDNFLFKQLKGVPKSRIYRAIRKGEVRVNKKRMKSEYKIQIDDEIRIPPLKIEPKIEIKFHDGIKDRLLQRIIYQDEQLLVLNKPAGIAVHAGSNIDFGIIEILRESKVEYSNLELVHRLDKETSGCLILAKQYPILKQLHALLRTNQLDKHYICLAKGNWDSEEKCRVSLPLRKNTLRSGERMVRFDPTGKMSKTEFKLLQRYDEASLLDAKLDTGRTHQIRVHLQHLQHPIAGDDKYGDRTFNKQMRRFGLKRLFLHAYKVKFKLPDSEKAITVTASLEDDLQQCLQRLKHE